MQLYFFPRFSRPEAIFLISLSIMKRFLEDFPEQGHSQTGLVLDVPDGGTLCTFTNQIEALERGYFAMSKVPTDP